MPVMAEFCQFVSTHSRLEAADRIGNLELECRLCFNTQPPRGG